MGAKSLYLELKESCGHIKKAGDEEARWSVDSTASRISDTPPPHGGRMFHKNQKKYVDDGILELLKGN